MTRAYQNSYSGGAISNKAYDAADDGTTSLKKVGFGVFGYHSGYKTINAWGNWDATTNSINKAPNFMYNEKMEWNTTKNNWDYSPVKYWPNGTDAANAANNPSNTATEQEPQYLSFFAYAPYTTITETDYNTSTGTYPSGVTAAKTTDNVQGIVAMSANSQTTDMQVKYMFGADATETSAVDLLWGLRGQDSYQETDNNNNTNTTLGSAYNTDLTKQIVGEKVKFLLKHALARVGGSTNSTTTSTGTGQICGLKVVVDVDKNETDNSATGSDHSSQGTYFTNDFDNEVTLVTIKEVKIRDQYTYSQEVGSTITETRSDFITEGWFNIMKGTWDATTATSSEATHANGVTYSVTANNTETVDNAAPYALNDKIKEPTTAPSKSNINTDKWSYGNDYGVDLTAKNVYADENVPGLLLIPAGTAGNTLYVTIDYIVRTADSKLDAGFTQVEQIITNKVSLGSSLAANKYYTLVMHLGLTSVKFEAVVADWSNGDNNYDENGKEDNPGTGNGDAIIWLPSNVVSSTSTALSGVNISTPENASVNVAAATAAYAITTTGKTGTLSAAVYTDAGCTSAAGGSYAATIDGTDANKINVTLEPNTTSKNKVVYVKITDGDTSKSSIITITQAAADLAITPTYSTALESEKIVANGATITLDVNDAAGSNIDLTNASNTSTINATISDGTAIGTITKTTTGATIVVPENSGTTDRTITYSVKVNDADVQTFTITQAGVTAP